MDRRKFFTKTAGAMLGVAAAQVIQPEALTAQTIRDARVMFARHPEWSHTEFGYSFTITPEVIESD